MKLTLADLRALSVGAVDFEEKNGILFFYKCTKKQREVWLGQSAELGHRACVTTGVRLDFHTDARSLTFVADSEGKYELFVDDLLRKQFWVGTDIPCGEPAHFDLCDALGNEKESYRVTLHFPNHKVGSLSLVELEGATYAHRHEFDCKILMIGDSITQGWNAKYNSLSYAHHVSRFFNADIVDQGIGGAYFLPESFDRIDFDPDIVMVAYGTNDFSKRKTYESLREYAGGHLDLIAEEYRDKKIFVLSPIWRGKREGKAMGSFEGCRAVIAEEAEKRGMIHIDGLALVPPIPEFFADEYLHPNDMGFSLYALNLIREMQKYL